MGLNNEAYLVNTGTAGEVIVPIKESVQYLNVKFLGWQFYNYHEVMSQNLANLADDVQTLKDGGGANLSFQLEELVAATQLTIDNKILEIDERVISQVATLTEEVLYTNNLRITALETTINGDATTDGLIALLALHTSLIGDAGTGIIRDINVLKSMLGDAGNGLVNKVDINTNNISTMLEVLGDATKGLIKQSNTNTTLGNELNASLAELENTVGDVNSGLIKQVNSNTTYINTWIPIIGDSTKGLVKNVNDLMATMTRVELDTNFAELALVVGDANSGLVRSTNTNATDISNIKLAIGDENLGILGDIKVLNSYNILKLSQDFYGITDTDGMVNIVGDSTKGLVKDFNELKSSLLTTVPASAADMLLLETSLAETDANVLSLETNLLSTITNLATLGTEVQLIDDQINLPGTGILDLINKMPNTITNSLLTYNNGAVTKTFDQPTLYDMYLNSKLITDNNIVQQFRSYFYDTASGAYISNVKIGKSAVDAWVNDISSTGYEYLTNKLIKAQISTNPTLDQIIMNKDAITILNGDESIIGSVANQVQNLNTILLDTDPANLGVISIINGDSTVVNSTDYKIRLNDEYLLSDTGPLGSSIIRIATLEGRDSSTDTKINQLEEEIQVEMVRYSTILPFLQQMFKLVNKVDNVTDAEIDLIFTTITDKLNTLTISAVDYKLSYDNITNRFTIKITLDKDFSFLPYVNTDVYHISLTDPSGNDKPVVLSSTQLTSKTVNIELNNIFDTATNSTIVINDTVALNVKLNMRIINSFGTEQLITVPVS